MNSSVDLTVTAVCIFCCGIEYRSIGSSDEPRENTELGTGVRVDVEIQTHNRQKDDTQTLDCVCACENDVSPDGTVVQETRSVLHLHWWSGI